MKVIILKKLKKIGEIGTIKEVADGYAINFLFPQGIACPATKKNINTLNKEKNKKIKEVESSLAVAEKNVERLQGLSLEIKGKCNEEGKLYASIAEDTIAKKLKDIGFNVCEKQINLTQPIKDIGEHHIFIVFGHGLKAEITVIVIE